MAQTESGTRLPVRVLMVDDERIFRRGLRADLELFSDRVALVGEAGSTQEAIRLARELSPDLVLLDLRIPLRSMGNRDCEHGLAVLKYVKREMRQTQVLILSNYIDGDDILFAALRAGAQGCLSKSEQFEAEDVVDAIEKIVAGQAIYGPAVAEMMRRAFVNSYQEDGPFPQPPDLSWSEREILVLRAQGKSNAEIADELTIEPANVKSTLAQLLDKLHRLTP